MSTGKGKKRVTQDGVIPSAALDDAIALLLQLQPGDIEGFKRLSGALESVVAGNSMESVVAAAIASKEQIDRIIKGEACDQEDILSEISMLLEEAANAQEAAFLESVPAGPQASDAKATFGKETAGEADIPISASVAESVNPNLPLDTPAPEPARFIPSQETQARESVYSSSPSEDQAYEFLPPDADRDLLLEFVAESRELLESSETALLELEHNPGDKESVNKVFRAFHTVKGTSGFLGLKLASELAHLAESLLSRIRNKEIRLVGGYADLALRSLDMLKKAIVSVEAALQGAPLFAPEGYQELKAILANPEAAGVSEEITIGPAAKDEVQKWRADSEDVETDNKRESLPEESAAARPNVNDSASAPARQQASQRDAKFESSIRVNTARLDRLINMVGELVIAQSMVAQDRRLMDDNSHDLLRKVTHAGKIVRELQDLSMSMRMVPLRGTFQKMQRVARDLARKSGKNVELIADDGEAEIDRHMVDILNDVLVHMVRNAIDHGIESPDERQRAGKNRTGTVRLAAFHSGGSVVVEINDDGRGLNREKILRKSIEAGLVDPDKPPGDSEVFNLIFAPGMSTSETVTDISGRGVGMDVVHRGVESLHGRVDINTTPGLGSTFTVRLPLTLAVTDGMLVQVGTEKYIIPTVSIHVCFRPKPEQLSTVVGRGELVMLRGDLMPVFRLHRLFGVKSAIENPAQGLLVVIGDEERRCALLVDELLGQQQVVAKSLNHAVGKVQGVSGGAILGDGKVGLILDPGEVVALARQSSTRYGLAGRYSRTAA